MADWDDSQRRLTIKIVYYGPALSGKTTNLMRLHDLCAAELVGDMMTLETQNDRTLFFDLLPLGFHTPSGWLVKFKLYTVPGQVAHDSTRKALLSRADGVVFVADSQRNQGINNGVAFDSLADNAARVGLDFAALPLVVQFNKRDLTDIVPEEEIRARWASTGWPVVLASAVAGQGVRETFGLLLEHVFDGLQRQVEHTALAGMDRAAFVTAALGAARRT